MNMEVNHFDYLVCVMIIYSWAATKLAIHPESEHLPQANPISVKILLQLT